MHIDYNMTREYRSHWSAYDAIREIVQNASDAGSYECHVGKSQLTVSNDKVISLDTLMLGESQKSSDSVGRYGEGYKIAMLILTREGMNPEIHTGGYKLTGSFKVNSLGVESFGIDVEEVEEEPSTTFICDHHKLAVYGLIRRIPAFEKPLPKPDYIDVLVDRPGQIYVNGLWVCEHKLTYGYNFHPSFIELNTDRNMVSGVEWQLAGFWGKTTEAELLFRLIENDANDVRDVSYRLHCNKLKAELARLFYNKYGEGAKIAKPGTSYFYIGGASYVSTSSSASRVYASCGIEEPKKVADPDAPHAVLEEFLERNKSKLRRDVRQELVRTIERAKGWSKSEIF